MITRSLTSGFSFGKTRVKNLANFSRGHLSCVVCKCGLCDGLGGKAQPAPGRATGEASHATGLQAGASGRCGAAV